MKYLCFDVGGTYIKAGLVDETGSILVKDRAATPVTGGRTAVIRELAALARRLLKDGGPAGIQVAGAGVGIPGFVTEDGLITKAPNLGWENTRVQEDLAKELGLPVLLLNDANAAALGEMWQGAGRDCAHLVCLTLGTGIGAGIILDRKIHTGAKGLAGEIGHWQVRLTGGRSCNCGKTGCLETESSGSALVYYGEEALRQNRETVLAHYLAGKGYLSPRDVVTGAAAGDRVAREIMEQAAQYLGLALANLYLAVAPQKIIIGGGVAQAGEVLFQPVIKWFNRYALAGLAGEEIILPARLGNDAGLLGLAYLVKQQMG